VQLLILAGLLATGMFCNKFKLILVALATFNRYGSTPVNVKRVCM